VARHPSEGCSLVLPLPPNPGASTPRRANSRWPYTPLNRPHRVSTPVARDFSPARSTPPSPPQWVETKHRTNSERTETPSSRRTSAHAHRTAPRRGTACRAATMLPMLRQSPASRRPTALATKQPRRGRFETGPYIPFNRPHRVSPPVARDFSPVRTLVRPAHLPRRPSPHLAAAITPHRPANVFVGADLGLAPTCRRPPFLV
jgi:hypothetical protein